MKNKIIIFIVIFFLLIIPSSLLIHELIHVIQFKILGIDSTIRFGNSNSIFENEYGLMFTNSICSNWIECFNKIKPNVTLFEIEAYIGMFAYIILLGIFIWRRLK